jgi:superoxide dismutase, Fe-Mn family
MTSYVLPELPFAYDALEPHISARIMELHHARHHAAYVSGANRALTQLKEARASEQFDRLPLLERALAFNLSGHLLHSVFWRCLTPSGGGQPTGALRSQVDKDFGSMRGFKGQMNAVAGSIMGAGWAALVWEPDAQRLLITQIHDHQSNTVQDGMLLLVMDAWEHAYYLQYENRKGEFFEALWNLWHWADIGARFELATAVKRGLRVAAA